MTTDATGEPNEPSEERLRQWHRLFGIALMEVFEGAPWRVELEQELALRSQLLDVAIIEATGEAADDRQPRGKQDQSERHHRQRADRQPLGRAHGRGGIEEGLFKCRQIAGVG